MNRVVWSLLIWLLIAVLPLQGIAAGIRMSCVVDAGSVVAPETAVLVAQLNMSAHHHHAGMSHAGMDAKSVPTPDAHTVDHLNHHKNASCSSCGSCCIGAFALPVPCNISLNDAQASVNIVSPSPLVAGYIPDGLERPPRQISA